MNAFTVIAAMCVAAGPPIPQDTELAAKLQRESLAYHRKSLGKAYDKIGHTDPKWDKQARDAFEVAARHFSADGNPPPDTDDLRLRVPVGVERRLR